MWVIERTYMYRMLNNAARAPLPLVHKAMRRYERACRSDLSRYNFERDCIAILHRYNWRKCDYQRELRHREVQAQDVRRNMCGRPFSP